MSTRRKTSRLEARIAPQTLARVKRAASLTGNKLSDFVVRAAEAAADEAIARHELLDLSAEDQLAFAEAILKPRRPAPAMKRAAAAHGKLIRRR